MTFMQSMLYLLRRILLPSAPRTMEWHMLRLLNKDRKKHGLPPVYMQDDLREVARKHSRDMARKDYFSHTNPHGKSPGDRLKNARVTDAVSGENLAKIGGFARPTVRAETGLMNSPGHRANILNESYNAVGIGVVKSATRVVYYTQNFAKREIMFKHKPAPKTSLKKGLSLEGRTLRNLKEIIIQVEQPHVTKELHRIQVKDKRFNATLRFPSTGLFHVKCYVPSGVKHQLANAFDVRVKRGLWS